ncbi:unnamed protein product [Spirodela intermedia]|uniref:Nuclear transcription factor Y subunit n=1 Tax=Spirodela intermedia TaxID=51605 RepID=A0A7I8KTX1_SPIIN|nr:unnamed protein product [Spirodela intermedia]
MIQFVPLGEDNCNSNKVEDHIKLAMLLGTSEVVYPVQKTDSFQSVTYIPCAYMDPFYGSGMVGYGPHSMVHPQVGASAPSRVPLPNELSEDGPIYVNAKQYHAILRRRQLRAKLEAKNKLIKGRKPYLHESRHLHAMKRVRGSGGRFLKTKKQEQQQHSVAAAAASTTDSEVSSSPLLQLGEKPGSSGSSCAGFTSDSHGNVFLPPEPFGFPSEYTSQQRVSAIR